MLSDDPQESSTARRVRPGRARDQGPAREMTRTQQDLEQYAQDAEAQMKKLETGRRAKAEAQKKIEKRIEAGVRSSSPSWRRRRRSAWPCWSSRPPPRRRPRGWLRPPRRDQGEGDGAGRQGRRVRHRAVGKPYQWGAEGPNTYDCSD
ncbi:hypothetical protein GCM10023238_24160 [Streptomyces heliomycini]